MTRNFDPDSVKFNADGLVPVVAQDELSGDLLTLAWANQEALRKSQETGFVHHFSRSRSRLWKKGEESGNTQRLVSYHVDCDGDAVLALVRSSGPACHTGAATCFAPKGTPPPGSVLAKLSELIETRKTTSPEGSYTAQLLRDENLRIKKLGEESTELVMALKGEGKERVASEAADVVYHLLVACAGAGVAWRDIAEELGRRRK